MRFSFARSMSSIALLLICLIGPLDARADLACYPNPTYEPRRHCGNCGDLLLFADACPELAGWCASSPCPPKLIPVGCNLNQGPLPSGCVETTAYACEGTITMACCTPDLAELPEVQCLSSSDCAAPAGECLEEGVCFAGECVYPAALDGQGCGIWGDMQCWAGICTFASPVESMCASEAASW